MGKKKSHKTIFFFLFFFVFSSAIAYAEEMEYKEYTVLKGDTLWDISSKEIFDPFLWPKIWKENTQIGNPDRIYPGQVIRIPLRLLEKEQVEEVTTEKAVAAEPVITTKKEEPLKVERKIEPITKNYLVDKDVLIASGYITDYIAKEVKSVGKIIGSPSGRTLHGVNDYVYVKTNTPAKAGEKFYSIRSDQVVRHPKTDKKLGHLIEVLGIVEIVGAENGQTKAMITKSYSDIINGDLLDTFYEIEPVMEEDTPRKPDVGGVIVATRLMKTINGDMDILFIDKGSNDGLKVGDMLGIISIDKYNNARTSGMLHVIRLKGSTATAVIRKSESAVSAGDVIIGLK